MNKNLKIMDWLVHGGHQYEFFKAGCEFYCSLPDGGAPDPACTGRPVNKNVKYVFMTQSVIIIQIAVRNNLFGYIYYL